MIFNQLRIKALFVRAKGIEPIRLAAPDPKSGLSTNFNTPAYLGLQMYNNLSDLQTYSFFLSNITCSPHIHLLFLRIGRDRYQFAICTKYEIVLLGGAKM